VILTVYRHAMPVKRAFDCLEALEQCHPSSHVELIAPRRAI
jgi:hypothetical protein